MSKKGLTLARLNQLDLNEKLGLLDDMTQHLSSTNGTLEVAGGGTNQTTFTLGDTLYGDSTKLLSKLAGNTTTTKKYLSETGTGTISAIPVWAQVAVVDLSGFGANVAAFLATPSSANLAAALTDETGTGVAVFGTSPTLTTPLIGNGTTTGIQVDATNPHPSFPLSDKRVSTQFNKTSDTTLANITGLSVNVTAAKTYTFESILYTSSNVAGGVKVAIAGTATATAIIYEVLIDDTAAISGQGRATALGTGSGVTAVTVAYIRITGTITVNAAGTLTVQFAQNASNGAASSVLVGSTFRVVEVQ